MDIYKPRYEGARWTIVYGAYRGIEAVAVDELQRIVQACLPYVVAVRPAEGFKPAAGELPLYLGTPANNPRIDELVRRKRLALPAGGEGYAVAVGTAPGKAGGRFMAVAGRAAKGVLNGVADFGAKAVGKHIAPLLDNDRRAAFDRLPDLAFSGQPVLENRGIWTWGYVIYDYRRFLDNMARLKLNMLVIWNDCAPLNLAAVVRHAHARGIRVICGFHWGWGLDVSLTDGAARKRIKAAVLAAYEEQYRDQGIDGIYLQTVTEHAETERGGKSTAALACEWVNDIGRALLARYPDLTIQFGLHATSMVGHHEDLKSLDERIAIIWEDAGTVPYCTICRETGAAVYTPALEFPAESHLARNGLGDVAGTIEFSKRLASFRGKAEFGLCPKGYSNLDWEHEFEHHGPFILGERTAEFVRRRYDRKKSWLDAMDRQWLKAAPHAARFYREVREQARGPMTAVALVEDALFEHAIAPSVALFAETVWDPRQPDEALLDTALSGYYRET
jgi:hypothetical protein